MPLDIEIRDQDDLTAVTVTLRLDIETCYQLSEIFKELGGGLYAAQSAYKGRRRFRADEPRRRAVQETQRAAIASRVRGLKDLPPRKAVSVIAKEFGLPWDIVDLTCIEIRRAERRTAALERDEKVMQLSKNRASAETIGECLGLSPGTVRNILTRLRKTASCPENEKAMAFGE